MYDALDGARGVHWNDDSEDPPPQYSYPHTQYPHHDIPHVHHDIPHVHHDIPHGTQDDSHGTHDTPIVLNTHYSGWKS